MISYEIASVKNGKHKLSFYGLSTDTKPTGTYETLTIANGSTFFEMDSFAVKVYDEEHSKWLPEDEE